MNNQDKKQKSSKSLIIIRILLITLIALYNFILFIATATVEKQPTFWLSYLFIMLVPILMLVFTFLRSPFTGGTNVTLSLPLLRVVLTYCSIEFIVGNLFIVFQKSNPIILALIVQVLLLVSFAIIFLVILIGASKISEDYQKQKQDVFNLNMLYTRVDLIASTVQSTNLKTKLYNVAEKIKYSDFNSYPENFDLELEINTTISEIEESNSEENSLRLALKLEKLVLKRQASCQYIKKLRG